MPLPHRGEATMWQLKNAAGNEALGEDGGATNYSSAERWQNAKDRGKNRECEG